MTSLVEEEEEEEERSQQILMMMAPLFPPCKTPSFPPNLSSVRKIELLTAERAIVPFSTSLLLSLRPKNSRNPSTTTTTRRFPPFFCVRGKKDENICTHSSFLIPHRLQKGSFFFILPSRGFYPRLPFSPKKFFTLGSFMGSLPPRKK